jgi:hypothetical protein
MHGLESIKSINAWAAKCAKDKAARKLTAPEAAAKAKEIVSKDRQSQAHGK